MIRKFTSLAAVLLLLASCSSESDNKMRKLEANEKNGDYNALYEETETILKTKENYSADYIAKIEEMHARAEKALEDNYRGTIYNQLNVDDPSIGLSNFELAAARIPAIEKDFKLMRLVMRAKAGVGELEAAVSIAETISSEGKGADKADADKFLARYQELKDAEATKLDLEATVEAFSARSGVDYTQIMTGGSCGMMNGVDKTFTPEEEAVLRRYLAALSTIENVTSELANLKVDYNVDDYAPSDDELNAEQT